jgi:maleylpyruvate isomerase
MKLVLHNYWRSSASHRVRIGLGIKGLPFEYVAVHLVNKDQFGEAYVARNPMSQVPTLEITEDDGVVRRMTQSLPILEYLDERWPDRPRLLPVDVFLRARARGLAEIVNSGIQPHQNLTTLGKLKELGQDGPAWAKHFIGKGLDAFQQMAREVAGAFSVGDAPSVADCCLIPQLHAARRFGLDISNLDLLLRIEERCLALPAFVNAAPENQPDAVK